MANKTNLKNRVGLSVFLFAMAGLVQARTITVGPGVNYDFSAIQTGIDAATDGDTILVASGEYIITEPITFRGKAIMVLSEAGRDETTIRMGTPADTNRGSVVIFEDEETPVSVLDGFTITGGRRGSWFPSENTWGGGGILFDASSGTVRNCAIVQNRAKYGAGVGAYFGSFVTLIDCIVEANSAEEGVGGVMCWKDSLATLIDCTIIGNSSVNQGGGVYCGGQDSSQKSSLTMTDCVVSGNSSADAGGGVACWYGSLTLTRCAILDNTGGYYFGGGVYAGHGSATLTNCVIARNTAARGGGGVCSSHSGAFITISNCTIWGNSAGSECGGGGVLCRNASAMVTNSIIWGNTSPKGSEISVEDPASALTVTYSDIAGGQTGVSVEGGCTLDWGMGNIDADPLFARLGYWDDKGTRDSSDDFWLDGDYHLKSQAGRWNPDSQTWIKDDVRSPCIDVGDPMSPIGWEAFPNGGFVNMGAYGGTLEASKSYFGEPVCETIVAGDINGDGQVNRADLEIMALHWTDEEPLPLR